MDGGFKPGRQFGRGRSGGQMRDDRVAEKDPARGGLTSVSQLKSDRAPHNPSGRHSFPSVSISGNKRGRENNDNAPSSGGRQDAFGRDSAPHKKPYDPLSQGLSSARAAPRKYEDIVAVVPVIDDKIIEDIAVETKSKPNPDHNPAGVEIEIVAELVAMAENNEMEI
jgi:hypothetical protein